MNKKLLIGIGVAAILVILAALLGKYIGYDIGYEKAVEEVSPEGDGQDQELYKLYTNEFRGFTFNYPIEWIEHLDAGVGDPSGIIIKTKNLEMTDWSNVSSGGFIYIPYVIGSTSDVKSLDTLFDGSEYTEISNLALDGQPAKQGVVRKPSAISRLVVYEYPDPIGGVRYAFISLVASVDEYDELNSQFDEMLESFRFINPTIP